jgi:hypothetical protein
MITLSPPAERHNETLVLLESNRALIESRMTRCFRNGSDRFLQVRALSLSGNSGFCIESGEPEGGHRDLHCLFRNTSAELGYDGDKAYVPDFLALLQGATPSQHIVQLNNASPSK